MDSQDTTQPGLRREPDEWKTGDEPMTAAQRSYLETLSNDSGETFDENLTKAELKKLASTAPAKTKAAASAAK